MQDRGAHRGPAATPGRRRDPNVPRDNGLREEVPDLDKHGERAEDTKYIQDNIHVECTRPFWTLHI